MELSKKTTIVYAAGAAHPHKAPCARLLERVDRGEVAATIYAETLQGILHRSRAIMRWNDGRQVYDRARALLDRHPARMARDALHAAVVMHEGLDAIQLLHPDKGA